MHRRDLSSRPDRLRLIPPRFVVPPEVLDHLGLASALASLASGFERHRADILHRLGLRDRVDLTRYAIRRGLIEP
jgi:hypothetical protein